MWYQKLIWVGVVVLCFSIYVLISYAFRGNLLINCYGHIMGSQKVVCILYPMCGPVIVMNCS